MTQPAVLTVGHSNHPLGRFAALLRQHGVEGVADVRSVPYSRRNPQFSREALQQSLQEAGIEYAYLGRELGGRSDDPACCDGGRVQYRLLAETAAFREGIARLRQLAGLRRFALMCAEREPLECHRTLLVSRVLVDEGWAVSHILADGSTESHAAAMMRLVRLAGLPQEDFFRTRDELIAAACAWQEARIAPALKSG